MRRKLKRTRRNGTRQTAPLDLHRSMDEAFNHKIELVDRDTMVKGVTEPWLQVTYRGRHIGWLPADTNMNVAHATARRWLAMLRQFEHDERAAPRMPSAAGNIVHSLTEGRR